MQLIEIKIARDFSPTPGPRYIREGEYSGELFRKSVLLEKMQKAIKENLTLQVNLDGTSGYGTSFLEESFGGLIREEGLDYHSILGHLEIITNEEEFLKDDVFFYLKDANEAEIDR